jgi:NAD(P)-dependent dehydrogenase (short-subunit alcohol dehydrogenase family)
MEKWTTDSIGSQIGKTALVTGGSEKVGLEVARELARNGAKVIICASDVARGEKALMDIRSSMEGAYVTYELVDFADLNSIKYFCEKIKIEYEELHLLINDADFQPPAKRIKSAQNHELMFAKNYLAHFSITAQLLPLLENADDARIIFQSAVEHEEGVLDFFDLDSTLFYDPHKAYAQSKLAVQVFARELDRRLRLTHLDIKCIPVHIGGIQSPVFSKLINYAFGQSAPQAALSTLFAATSSDAQSGHYYGPEGIRGMKGHPHEVDCAEHAKSLYTAERLWDVSEKMMGLDFSLRDMSNVLPFQMRANFHPETFI